MRHDYKKLEAHLIQLLADFGDILTADEKEGGSIVHRSRRVRVAFETLCSILKDQRKNLPGSVGPRIRELGETMGIDPDCWADLFNSTVLTGPRGGSK